MKQTGTLQIKGFPADVNRALKLKSVEQGVTFRQFVIDLLTKAAASNPASERQPASQEQKMTQKQLNALAVTIARRYAARESVRRSDVLRDVVRTKRFSLDDSIILTDCIVKGLYEAGKTIAVSA